MLRMKLLVSIVCMFVSVVSANLFEDDFNYAGANYTTIPTGVGEKWAPVSNNTGGDASLARYVNGAMDLYKPAGVLGSTVISSQSDIDWAGAVLAGQTVSTIVEIKNARSTASGFPETTLMQATQAFCRMKFDENNYLEMKNVPIASASGINYGRVYFELYRDGVKDTALLPYIFNQNWYMQEAMHLEFELTDDQIKATMWNTIGEQTVMNYNFNHGWDLSSLGAGTLELGYNHILWNYMGTKAEFDSVVVTPEPATLALMVGGLAMLRRRKRAL